MIKRIAWLPLLFMWISAAMADTVPSAVVHDLAPTGVLRAAINFGNPVLAQKDPSSGEPRGVSADLAQELARRLGVPLAFVTFDAAGKVFDALKAQRWDVAFLAIDPVRSAGIAFTAPYVVIEGTYMVRADSPLRMVDEVDRAGTRVAVGQGSAYDLYLTRALKSASLVRAASSPAAIDLFVDDHLDVAAGVKQPLVAYAAAHPGFRVMDGRFMVIEQAMGTPLGRDAGVAYLRGFVEEMKASGFVAKALAASGQHDATVAGPAQ
jgi:polar amino acid transport system substrate-binding protein